MRLLKREPSNGINTSSSFSLINFLPSKIPSVYAILSHRWGDEEVTLKDLESGIARTKPGGYRKLEFCAEQAARDGILYFWIDTCCIDKTNNTELSEAINSMFKWYQNATRCYVYLPDVSLKPTDHTTSSTRNWVSVFQASSWFTRGWTLQELIAPSTVDFFSVEGTRLGDKTSLQQHIHHVTNIPVEALRGSPLHKFTAEERFAWTTGRHTTVEEDAAYCLLGLFDVHMPLIYGEGRENALARLRRKIEKSLYPAPSNSVTSLQTVPFERNPRFTGRETDLAKLEARLFAPDHTSTWVVTGLGGVGKTQLVLELLYRTQAKYPDCMLFWIPAATQETLHQGYSAVARQLNISGCEDKNADVKTLVLNHLTNLDVGRWLLVFDNADDINLWTAGSALAGQEPVSQPTTQNHRLIDCVPRNRRGCVIFTTRDKKLAANLVGPNILTVSELSADSAKGMLSKYLSDSDFDFDDQQDASRLLEKLTYLPLAIAQAATYILKNDITVAEYLQLLEEKEEEVIDLLSIDFEDHGRYREIKNPIATTWLISFEQIQKHNQLAAEYLSFMACIHPKDIPRSLLPVGPSRQKELEAIGTLTAYSFVNRSSADGFLNLHRLVHLSTRNWLRKEGSWGSWLKRTVSRLEELFPYYEDEQSRVVWRTYIPHVLQILESHESHQNGNHGLNLMLNCGQCLWSDGRYNEAGVVFAQILAESSLGQDNTFLLETKIWLARTYREQGRLVEAEKLALQTLETINTAKLEADHPLTQNCSEELGSIYQNLRRFVEAEKLFVQVLEARKSTLGADHPDTVTGMNNLACVYQDRGCYVEAERLQIQVVEIRKRISGADHPYTLTGMNNLALTYHCQGRLIEAEELQVLVVEIQKRILGADHSDTLRSMSILAFTYHHQGRWVDAEELEVQVLATSKRILGVNHPDTLTIMHNLACIWKDMGRNEEAIQLMKETIQRKAKVLGVQDPHYLLSVKFLRRWEAERQEKEDAQQSIQERDEVSTPVVPGTPTQINHSVETSTRSSSADKPKKIKLSHRVKNLWRSSSKAGSSAHG